MGNTYNNLIKYANPDAGDCNWDDEWYRNNAITAAMLGQLKNANYVKEGLVPSIGTGLSVDFTAGTAVVDGTEYVKIAFNATLTAPSTFTEEPRFIWFDNTGALNTTVDEPDESACLVCIADVDATSVVRIIDTRQAALGVGGGVPDPVVHTSDFNVSVGGSNHLANVSGGSITATMPTSPAAGDKAYVGDYNNSCSLTNKIILTSADDIEGSASNYNIVNAGCNLILQYVDATVGWKIVGGTRTRNSDPPLGETELWGGSAGTGVSISWSSTGYQAEDFDFMVFEFTGSGITGDAVFSVMVPYSSYKNALDHTTNKLGLTSYGNADFAKSLRPAASTLTETGFVVSFGEDGITGSFLRVAGIKFY